MWTQIIRVHAYAFRIETITKTIHCDIVYMVDVYRTIPEVDHGTC